MIRPDPVIPDHEVLRKIGGGAYGEVWLARGVTGALRAVKIVYREDFSDDRTFEREFEGILKFEPISRDHPGLVHILHVGRSDGEGDLAFYYYVMELGDDAHTPGEINPVEYEPRTVRTDALTTPGVPLDTSLCIETGRRLAEALQHLHERELTHRDVKPSNIIFVEGKAKLADIGLVAALDQRTFVGTEGFVPPEGPGTTGADIYSLGKVLYEMATGMDRLDFPELPMEGPGEDDRKKWIRLNRIICDVCEPRVEKRKVRTAAQLAETLTALEQGKKVRPEIPAGAKAVFAILAVLGFFIFQTWFQQSWGTKIIEGARVPLPLKYTKVVILSDPSGATVLDEEGEYLGLTKFDFKDRLEVGTLHTLRIQKERHQDAELSFIVKDVDSQVQVEEVNLIFDSPPVQDQIWEDALGMSYNPEGRSHVSSEYVNIEQWQAYQFDPEMDAGEREPIVMSHSAYGVDTTIVVTPEEWAKDYAEWLESKCQREGYLREPSGQFLDTDREIRVIMSQSFSPDKLPREPALPNARPFQLEVRPIPYARLKIDSNPQGADVFIGGRLVGTTPWVDRLPPGEVHFSVDLDGYQMEPGTIELADRDGTRVSDRPVPVYVELKPNKSITFGIAWQNSLGMKFAPLREDLMVSVYETRVSDFSHYLRSGGVGGDSPKFPQEPNHPVVNISREEAKAFCTWLTELEKGDRNRIKERNIYRLPTDEEWSLMAGLEEVGKTPAERDASFIQEDLYFWGAGIFPPPQNAGNYNGLLIDGFNDEFPNTAPVGRFQKSTTGLYDLGGNVYEWVEDDYQTGRQFAVARGAGWESHDEAHLAVRYRDLRSPETRLETHGFRVVIAKLPEIVPELEPEPSNEERELKQETAAPIIDPTAQPEFLSQ